MKRRNIYKKKKPLGVTMPVNKNTEKIKKKTEC